MDAFGKLAATFGAVLVMLLTIITAIAIKNENTAQDIIQNAIVQFVDNARATGVITSEDYETLCFKIDSVQELCEIKMTHSSADKVYNDDTGKYEVYYFDYPTSDVLETLYTAGSDGRYYFKQGDFFTLTVHNTAPTFATKMYRIIANNYAPNDVTIYATYSGYVGNDPQ